MKLRIKAVTNLGLRQADTTIYHVIKGQKSPQLASIATELKMKLTFYYIVQVLSSIREMFFSKLEPKMPFLRLQSHETFLSRLMNSTDNFINIQLNSSISSCFELRDKLVFGIINPTDG